MLAALIDPKRKDRSPGGRCLCLMTIGVALQFVVVSRAWAEGPGCTKDDLAHAGSSAPEQDIERRTKAVFSKLQECNGRLTQREEADALQDLLFYYHRRRYEDVDGCRSLAEKGLHLDLDKVAAPGELIAETYGQCGGDCGKVTAPGAHFLCEKEHRKLLAIKEAEAKAEIKARTGKLTAEVELEQAVTCDPKNARKTVATMDQRGFREQGLRFIRKYRETCAARMSADFKVSLANDEALLCFHRDDDATCMQALSALSDPVSDTTSWNRALCGGPCALAPSKCQSATAARNKALAERAVRSKRREITQRLCWDCKPGAPCGPPMKGDRPLGWGTAFRWDLKSARNVGGGNIRKPYEVYWTGDLNGDGIGDFITVGRDNARLYDYLSITDAEKMGLKNYAIPYKIFDVQIGCGAYSEFREIWNEKTDQEPYSPPGGAEPGELDHFEIRIEKKPNSDIPSVCIYSTALGCTAKTCSDPPVRCLDLSKWESVASPPKQ